MIKIEPIGVEIWMGEWEARCAYRPAETCVESLTITKFLQLAERNSDDLSELLGMKMTMVRSGARVGCAMRSAACMNTKKRENIIVTHCTFGAEVTPIPLWAENAYANTPSILREGLGRYPIALRDRANAASTVHCGTDAPCRVQP
ncbi:hypothetical protein SAMN05444358_11528 [Ruegeria halocynthiae]|uniref:Uncharacterized protein n=1 Tax=Ruegeria halocynthiae TaxID=985054 RepID=A0A1H3FHT8_9RHOB|nr:hypothetical protein [Ruegeria halocynthiae]SDX90500.1 hypothetical protein SAMN05444358_11528 [Ruegeria halocynthiae]